MKGPGTGEFEALLGSVLRDHRTQEDLRELFQVHLGSSRREAVATEERDGPDHEDDVTEFPGIVGEMQGQSTQEFRGALETRFGDMFDDMTDRELEDMRRRISQTSGNEECLCNPCGPR